MSRDQERPFAELPAALVEELLSHSSRLSEQIGDDLQKIRQKRQEIRESMERSGLLRREGDLPAVTPPTTCGIDGAYAVERLIAKDLVAVVAVAVEGLTPPSETRFWPEPRYRAYTTTEGHEEEIGTIARGVMIGMELELAVQAPHEVVFLDGSLTTPLIYFNQALNRAKEVPDLALKGCFLEQIEKYLQAYWNILRAGRTDRAWVAVPKYSVRREIGQRLGWPRRIDDRAMLTNVLEPGEYTAPQPLEAPQQPWHLTLDPLYEQNRQEAERLRSDIVQLLNEIRVTYYRPRSWLPALRLEMSRSVAETPARLASVIQALHYQCSAPGMLEPYPLYLADRMVKHLGRVMPTLRQVTSQWLAKAYSGDLNDIFLNLHSYRTESGR